MPKSALPEKIKPCELRILNAMIKHTLCNLKGIADILCISPKTLYKELENARLRNKVSNYVALFVIAIDEGLVDFSRKQPPHDSDSNLAE